MKKLLIGIVVVAIGVFLWAVFGKTVLHVAAATATITHAQPPTEEFTVGKGPRLALLPVILNGKTLMFCVDTGAWKTIVDSSLRTELGQLLGKTTTATPSGFLEIELYRCPHASVGSLDLSIIESVGCHDLTKMRYASGEEIYGVLGMDFLKSYAVEFDFDAGKCRIWKSAPSDWARQQSSMMTYDESNRPFVTLTFPSSRAEQFVIDTGANASTLRSDVFDELIKKGDIHPATNHSGVAMAGTFRAQSGYANEIQLESFTHRNIRLDRDPFSALGIRYLSRYKVRLDFTGGKAYFAASSRFAVPDPIGTSGLAILQMNGEKVVYRVEPVGPAAALGVAPGDVVMSVAGRDAHQHDMVSLHEVLTREPGTLVPLKLSRKGQTFEVAVQLESRLILSR